MEFRAAEKADLEFVAEHSISRGCFGNHPECIDYVYTLVDGDKVLGVGGIKLMNKTNGWVWMDLTDEALKHKSLVFRIVREWIGSAMANMELTRVQAAVEVGFEEALRTVKHLGFHAESLMSKWKGDKDAIMYVRFE